MHDQDSWIFFCELYLLEGSDEADSVRCDCTALLAQNHSESDAQNQTKETSHASQEI